MKAFLLFFVSVLLFTRGSIAQNKEIQLSAGPSFCGSGDIWGISYGAEYIKQFKKIKRINWRISLGGSIHDGENPLFFEFPAGNTIDGSHRYTIAGLQTGIHLQYNFIKTKNDNAFISAGCIIRYQTNSNSDQIVYLYPAITNVPFPVLSLENTTPKHTIAVGGVPQVGYKHYFKNTSVGFIAGFQYDTNGDIIWPFMLTVGKRF